MALWLLAVIVLIAVGAMPSTAQAHAGSHDGGRSIHAGASLADLASHHGRKAAEASLRSDARAAFSATCDGPCCQTGCRSGTSCCTGAGLAPEDHSLGHAPRPRGQAPAWATSARTDVVPEALPEPPRSFA